MTVYSITLHTLTPLHIGDGVELHQDFDFAVFRGRTYRLNEDAILLAKPAALHPGRDGHYPAPGKLLQESDYQNADLFRYVLSGAPRSRQVDARMKSFIKDVYDRPYIPGSSLKGALRTALAWTGWPEVKLTLGSQHDRSLQILGRATTGEEAVWQGPQPRPAARPACLRPERAAAAGPGLADRQCSGAHQAQRRFAG